MELTSSLRRRPHTERALDNEHLWLRQPEGCSADAPAGMLGRSLGALAYVPATRPDLPRGLGRLAAEGAIAAVVCLEDAVADDEQGHAEHQTLALLHDLVDGPAKAAPLLFVRPREPDQLVKLVAHAGHGAGALTGFVLPKLIAADGPDWFAALDQAERLAGRRFLVMPILESALLLRRSWRERELEHLEQLLLEHQDRVVVVRVGGTDLCGALGVRRDVSRTIYDVHAVREVIIDIATTFALSHLPFAVSGAVWEHYATEQARTGLVAETQLDRANGLTGKTVIHPDHVRIVNALHAVRAEEHADAAAIVQGADTGGLTASPSANKMNEVRPHLRWAHDVLARGRTFGVLAPGLDYTCLL